MGLVEPVNLVHEENGGLVGFESEFSGLVDGVPDVFDAAGDGR